MFLTNAPFCQHYGNVGAVVVWLNLNSKQEVDYEWRDRPGFHGHPDLIPAVNLV